MVILVVGLLLVGAALSLLYARGVRQSNRELTEPIQHLVEVGVLARFDPSED